MMRRVLTSTAFWVPFLLTFAVTGMFFLWELGMFSIPSLARPDAKTWEVTFTGLIALLLSLNAGLIVWQSRFGSCPRGVKRASGMAGVIGAITLLCPVCLVLPASLIGVSIIVTFLGPFLPLLRVIAVLLLLVPTMMLWPRKR